MAGYAGSAMIQSLVEPISALSDIALLATASQARQRSTFLSPH
jgi:hypothetical protein